MLVCRGCELLSWGVFFTAHAAQRQGSSSCRYASGISEAVVFVGVGGAWWGQAGGFRSSEGVDVQLDLRCCACCDLCAVRAVTLPVALRVLWSHVPYCVFCAEQVARAAPQQVFSPPPWPPCTSPLRACSPPHRGQRIQAGVKGRKMLHVRLWACPPPPQWALELLPLTEGKACVCKRGGAPTDVPLVLLPLARPWPHGPLAARKIVCDSERGRRRWPQGD